jgi:hypothetical protein
MPALREGSPAQRNIRARATQFLDSGSAKTFGKSSAPLAIAQDDGV